LQLQAAKAGVLFMLIIIAVTLSRKEQQFPKNSAAIFCGVGFRVFGLLNVPKNLKIGFF